MKKKIVCFMLAAVMLLIALPSFADSEIPTYSIEYNAGYTTPVRHYFTTTQRFAKPSNKTWKSFTNTPTEVIAINPSNSNDTYNTYHKFYAAKNSGALADSTVFSYASAGSPGTVSASGITNATYARLRIVNTQLSEGYRMQTDGSASASVNP